MEGETEKQDEIENFLLQHYTIGLFDEFSFREKIKRVINGLKQSKDSGEYKYAKFQIIRLSAPVAAIVVPLLFIVLLSILADIKSTSPPEWSVRVIESKEAPDLDPIEPPPKESLKLPDRMDVGPTPEITTDVMVPDPDIDVNHQTENIGKVAFVKNPAIMKDLCEGRDYGKRVKALKEHKAPNGTEGAVLRALRWLKKEQLQDGSWMNNKAAMTGLALLTYLAHGETPSSEEFGPTVEKAIRWLVDNQVKGGGWDRRYQHAIATYAICEAYGLTKVPMLKDVAEKAVDIIIKGQTPIGGWRYALAPTEENDTSCMGWCAQALKAAHMAGLENEGLKASMKKAIEGFKHNAAPAGGFGYVGPGATGLTGVGVLCMQLLGAAKEAEARNGLILLEQATFNWEGGGTFNANYYWYYITQAKFHAGGDVWNAWNKLFAPVLVKNQTTIKNGIMDPKGEMVDIGYWEMDKKITGHTDGVVMDTSLATLQLEVYYRYLPTFKPGEEMGEEETTSSDIKIEIIGI